MALRTVFRWQAVYQINDFSIRPNNSSFSFSTTYFLQCFVNNIIALKTIVVPIAGVAQPSFFVARNYFCFVFRMLTTLSCILLHSLLFIEVSNVLSLQFPQSSNDVPFIFRLSPLSVTPGPLWASTTLGTRWENRYHGLRHMTSLYSNDWFDCIANNSPNITIPSWWYCTLENTQTDNI